MLWAIKKISEKLAHRQRAESQEILSICVHSKLTIESKNPLSNKTCQSMKYMTPGTLVFQL